MYNIFQTKCFSDSREKQYSSREKRDASERNNMRLARNEMRRGNLHLSGTVSPTVNKSVGSISKLNTIYTFKVVGYYYYCYIL